MHLKEHNNDSHIPVSVIPQSYSVLEIDGRLLFDPIKQKTN